MTHPHAPGPDPARDRIVQALRWGTLTVEELAARVGLTPNGVRANLAALGRDGVVERVGVRASAGVGKPPTLYRLTRQAEEEFSLAYPAALTALVETMAESIPEEELEAVLARAGARLAPQLPGGRAGEILAALGASVRVTPTASGGETVEGAACPLGVTVSRHPATCELVRSLLATRLGTDVAIRCQHGERPRCCFDVAAAG